LAWLPSLNYADLSPEADELAAVQAYLSNHESFFEYQMSNNQSVRPKNFVLRSQISSQIRPPRHLGNQSGQAESSGLPSLGGSLIDNGLA
jgi:hypothetical protein